MIKSTCADVANGAKGLTGFLGLSPSLHDPACSLGVFVGVDTHVFHTSHFFWKAV
jgi:hypothetical protein